MPGRTAEARWQRSLQDGSGTMRLVSGAFEGSYSFKGRREDGPGTNPEELLGAAHAACFSMAFAGALSQAGHKPQEIRTTAAVHFDKTEQGWGSPVSISRPKATSRVLTRQPSSALPKT